MILYQERPTQNWSLEEIRDHCQSCCPLTFDPENMNDLELRSLLNELIGLGVLAEDWALVPDEKLANCSDVWK